MDAPYLLQRTVDVQPAEYLQFLSLLFERLTSWENEDGKPPR
jgi:hypothetical protein